MVGADEGVEESHCHTLIAHGMQWLSLFEACPQTWAGFSSVLPTSFSPFSLLLSHYPSFLVKKSKKNLFVSVFFFFADGKPDWTAGKRGTETTVLAI